MTIEYLPVGIKCNLKCTYCYQEPMRDAGNFSSPVNFMRAKEVVIKTGENFTMFGGEPLLTPIEVLEDMWDFGFKAYGHNGIQTNGLSVTDKHIELFKKYRVNVGISIDGPGKINQARCSEEDTVKIINNFAKIRNAGVEVSAIVTIHKLSLLYLPQLLDFIDFLDNCGVSHINLHNLEVDNAETENTLRLDDRANLSVFRAIYEKSKLTRVSVNPFKDIRALLTEDDPSVCCIWTNCDPVTTPAVHGINAEGDLTNCGRTNKQGIDWLKGDSPISIERYKALSRIEFKYGGCKDCKYFFACKGQCPGTAIDGDWRNKTQDCQFWYDLIDYIREDLVNQELPVRDLDLANKDFLDYVNRRFVGQSRRNITHGDSPHGDSHGDHTDISTEVNASH